MAEGKIKIKLVRSPICAPEKHKAIVRSLGLQDVEPGGGASRHVRIPRHGRESASPAQIVE